MKSGRAGRIGIRVFAFATILAAIFLVAATPRAMAADMEDAQGIVDKARVTLSAFMRDKDYEWLRENIKKAKGVLIYPQVLKAGFILGGSGGEAARTIDSYEALIEFIKQGGDYSRQSPGAPIAYKLAYLKDNSPGRLSLTTDYDVTECERVSQRIKVTLVNLRVESAGGDSGGDLELFGRVWAHGTSAATLLDKGPGTHIVIREGTAWPQGAFASEAILDVRPAAGASIELGADLWDYDPVGANDAMGREVANAAFEAGWRRDVTVLLTGDGARVTATFRLQPI